MTLARPDLAPAACEGIARARAYDKARRLRVGSIATSLKAEPDGAATQVSQLLFGESFDVIREERGFAWGQACRDGYVGWVDVAALSADLIAPSHWVRAPRTAILTHPKIRAPSTGGLGMNALCRVIDESGLFSEVEGLGWVATAHLAPMGLGFGRPADIATAFLGAPYVWGARDGAGLDCSGLIQQSLHAAGLACPRDADQQATLGVEVAPDPLRAGDLVAWRGHIGMMLDARRLIHANAHHMAVAIEPLVTAIARIEAAGSGTPTAYRRPWTLTAPRRQVESDLPSVSPP
jgi:cell wall-associated NlpC family hydrolase